MQVYKFKFFQKDSINFDVVEFTEATFNNAKAKADEYLHKMKKRYSRFQLIVANNENR